MNQPVGYVRVETIIKAPIERCFDAHRDIDLHVRSTALTGERIVGEKCAGLLELGEEVTFEARHFGVRFRLTSHITEFDRPHRFVDEMVRGPFRKLQHLHVFERDKQGTKVIDEMEFSLPMGFLGNVAAGRLVEGHLNRFLIARNRFLKGILESE